MQTYGLCITYDIDILYGSRFLYSKILQFNAKRKLISPSYRELKFLINIVQIYITWCPFFLVLPTHTQIGHSSGLARIMGHPVQMFFFLLADAGRCRERLSPGPLPQRRCRPLRRQQRCRHQRPPPGNLRNNCLQELAVTYNIKVVQKECYSSHKRKNGVSSPMWRWEL